MFDYFNYFDCDDLDLQSCEDSELTVLLLSGSGTMRLEMEALQRRTNSPSRSPPSSPIKKVLVVIFVHSTFFKCFPETT